MSVSYFVLYRGEAGDLAAFIQRYRKDHVPILLRWPGVRRVALHTPAGASDPKSTNFAGLAMMAEIVFDDEAALAAALNSDERAEARQDFARFPPFHGDVLHQALQTESFAPGMPIDGQTGDRP